QLAAAQLFQFPVFDTGHNKFLYSSRRRKAITPSAAVLNVVTCWTLGLLNGMAMPNCIRAGGCLPAWAHNFSPGEIAWA
ncbi:MAG TPA: hypothetical protein VKR26_11375, partial [Terriglobales bacterium]|nr:hypothetical protein [Terriglobales bacterium]